jgi:hypothetical protein
MESNALLSAAMGASSRQSSWDGGPVDPIYRCPPTAEGAAAAGGQPEAWHRGA